MIRISKQLSGVLEMLFAGVIWGFGFTATIWALQSFDPISISLLRFGIAFALGAIILLLTREGLGALKPEIRRSIGPGIFLGLTLNFQTWGLLYTTATKSGFITTLYVVLVPMMEWLILRKRLHPSHFLWVLFALVGTGMMVELHAGELNVGDLLTLICAIAAAIQIVWVGKIASQVKSAFAFNTAQSLWCVAVSALFIPFYPELRLSSPTTLALIGMFSLTVGSTLIAFALQIKAQRVLSPSLASLLFLLESPIAAFFAYLLLNEHMNLIQAGGAALIFVAAFAATVVETRILR